MRVVICGGGIVGVSVAYHLAKKSVKSTIIERCEPACAASGKAGGFLAKDWCDSYELGSLCRIGFDMHMKLLEDETFKDCEYRRLDTYSINVREGRKTEHASETLPKWVDGPVTNSSVLGSCNTTAQVHPKKLTETMIQISSQLVGTEVRIGVVEGINKDSDNKVTGVQVDGEVIPADVVVIAMGPWSHQAVKWFDIAAIEGQRAHSIVLQPQSEISAHALFVEYHARQSRSPEIYPRPDGTAYVCGMSDREKIPADPAKIKPNVESCRTLQEMSSTISTSFKDARVLVEQACYLPISPDGLPLIGAIPNTKGAYIGAGHSCWGILNSLVTGEALAQLIAQGECKLLDLKPFNPARFL